MVLFPEIRPLSLVRLSALVARSVAGLGTVMVEGEVVNPRQQRGGRLYLTLRDRTAQIQVMVPATRRRRCRAVHGERVRVTGAVEYAARQGQLQLAAEEMVPVGEGAIAAMILATRSRLEADGLLARPRRPVPALPATIGVVCGGGAAVQADIESVVAARFPGYPLVFAAVTVTGPGAPDSIVEGMRSLASKTEVEVVILARGGGDAGSLLVWSDEDLCRAVAACPVAVVSAIGHEGDRPLCDEVADLRAGTPSLAATAVVPDEGRLCATLEDLRGRASLHAGSRLAAAGLRLEGAEPLSAMVGGLEVAARRLERVRVDPTGPAGAALSGRLAAEERRLSYVPWRRAVVPRAAAAAEAMAAGRRTLEALDPHRVLDRGYAVVRTGAGEVVRRPGQLAPGEGMEIELAEGSLAAVATGGQ